ncbi:MAG TPA: hypothetical protein VLB74_07080 [Flavobacterium sp.]|uniref:hypothetical protein n=1 Tax=Flavobacterium sp. TaxID=239 RepID=UPI002BC11F48|nr:hypothetical protein [Flavobacterium sp.]HSD14395.1 hypothetical protein [Flavobacterium sp.]
MKKLFLLGVLLISTLSFGQDLGIGKTESEIFKLLEADGFDYHGWRPDGKDGNTILTFENTSKLRCYVHMSEKKERAYESELVIEFKTWEDLLNNYNTIKSQFTTDFGKPTKNSEKFSGTYKLGDGNEIKALENGYCIYETHFKDKDNTLYELTINKDNEYSKARILIVATNKKYL